MLRTTVLFLLAYGGLSFQQSPVSIRKSDVVGLSKPQISSHRRLNRFPDKLQMALEENDQDKSGVDAASSLWLFGGVPLLSLTLPLLLQAKLIVPLVIAKRVYIYLMAATVLTVASIRGASDSPALGTRLIDLTREILPNSDNNNSIETPKEDQRFQEMAVLDEVDDSTQAVGLPLLVVSSLVVSLSFVLLQNSDFSATTTDSAASGFEPLLESIQSVLPQLVTLSNGLVISLFTRAELARAPLPIVYSDESQKELVATAGALGLTALAYLGPSSVVWPIQNLVCMCLAISVARAVQLPRLGPILLALGGLVAYDVVSVGIQLVNLGSATMVVAGGAAAAAVDGGAPAAAATNTAASSAMGAVAMSKAAGAWQPGLFEVKLRGITTDLLGLGDAVFPALLSTFCLRYDESEGNNSSNYFGASLLGFATGCAACEFVPGISDTGLPALLFIVPSMLTAVVGLGAVQGNLGSLWSFEPEEK